jgi:hypothetical protein
MYIVPLEGGEAAYCPDCYKAGKHLIKVKEKDKKGLDAFMSL